MVTHLILFAREPQHQQSDQVRDAKLGSLSIEYAEATMESSQVWKTIPLGHEIRLHCRISDAAQLR